MGCPINCSLKSIRCYNVAKLGQRVCIDIKLMTGGIGQQKPARDERYINTFVFFFSFFFLLQSNNIIR